MRIGGSLVEILNESTFRQFLRSHPVVVVKIGATWCPRSIHLTPQFTVAAQIISSRLAELNAPQVLFAEIDGPSAPGFMSDYALVSYPVVVMVEGKTSQIYNGDRTVGQFS